MKQNSNTMVSMQPTNQSYFADEESCFLLPKTKCYRKGSLMSVLMIQSPIFAFLAQKGNLDELLDSEEFSGTVFAPGPEYCQKNFQWFNSSTIDHQRAREMVLSATLRHPMTQADLYAESNIEIPFDGFQTAKLPTLSRYNEIQAYIDPITQQPMINYSFVLIKGDLFCSNGVLHLLNGVIEPEISI